MDTLEQDAKAILQASRNYLVQRYPDFYSAFYLLKEEAVPFPQPLASDGVSLFYHPATVIETYLQGKSLVAQEMFHIVLHGLLGHFFQREGQEEPLFDATADLAVATFQHQLTNAYPQKNLPTEVKRAIQLSAGKSAQRLYLTVSSPEEAAGMLRIGEPLRSDFHGIWNLKPTQGLQLIISPGKGRGAKELWAMVAKGVAESLKNSQHGHLAGALDSQYDVTPSTVDYGDFLERFFKIHEQAVVDPDSFDPIWYHLGLECTGSAPLLEPNEWNEHGRSADFVLAIDTSGSCQGDLVRQFLGEVQKIIQDVPSGHLSIALVQCDARIQKVDWIQSREDTEDWDTFQVKGGGGTDFCPVFDFVAKQAKKTGRKPSGLLYLSDGYGDFPERAPDYPVAFILTEECSMVPDWVTTAVIEENMQLAITEAGE